MLYAVAGIGIVLAILICVVQIVLWSSTPRNLAMSIIQEKLGIRAQADTLSTTWFGRTTLHNVRLGLPLSDQPFLTIPTVIVHHRWLTGLAVTGDIGLRSIELDHPTISIRRDLLGRWNIQDVIDMIAGIVSPPGAAPGPSGPLELPAVTIVAATIQISDAQGRSTSIGPINVDGVDHSAVDWQFAVTIPDHLKIDGMLAPGGAWRHEMNLSARDVSGWFRPWLDRIPDDAQIAAHWAGQMTASPAGPSLVGLFMMRDLSAGPVRLEGLADATVGPDVISLAPRALTLLTPGKLPGRVNVIGGSLALASGSVTVQHLALQLLDGPAKLDASYNLAAGTGQLSAAWDRLAVAGGVVNSGSITAALSRPFPTQLQLDASGTSSGWAPGGPFSASYAVNAAGTDWTYFDWQARSDSLLWQRAHPIDLSGLHLSGKMRGTKLSLDSVARLADADLQGNGFYDFAAKQWSLLLAGRTWPFHPAEGLTFAFHLDTDGDRNHVQLHDFSLRNGGDSMLVATGSYTYAYPKPVSLDVRYHNLRAESGSATPALLGGKLQGNMHLSGTVWPRQLDVTGQLHGTELSLGPHHLGAVALKISGVINDELADIKTERLSVLGGKGDVEGIYSFAGDALDVGIVIRDLSLAQAGRLIGRTDCAGVVGGHWHLYLPGLSTDRNRIRLSGLFQATDGAVGTVIAADQIDAQTTLENGTLTVSPITMLYGSDGVGAGAVSVDLANLNELRGAISLTKWPVRLPEADGSLSVDLAVPSARIELPSAANDLQIIAPKVDFEADATLQNKPAGHIQLLASSAGRIADLQQMHVTLLDGTVDGHGHLDLDQFSRSAARMAWQKLDCAAIAEFVPDLTGLSGRMTGSCTIEPATGVLALEPLALHLRNIWTKGHYKTITLKDLTLNGYLNRTPQYSRIVLADDPAQKSVLSLAGGTATIWARAGVEPTGVDRRPYRSTLAQVSFAHLDISELLDAVDPSIKAVQGRLGGSFMVLGNSPPSAQVTTVVPAIDGTPPDFDIFAPPPAITAPATPKPTGRPRKTATAATSPTSRPALASFINRFYGEGHASLTESNLANLGVLTQIYNIMHFSFGSAGSKPEGFGEIDVRMESGNLDVTNLRYFNRGTEVDALASISNLADLPDSSLKGSAIGALHPLSQIHLPFFSDVDTILAILQQSVTPITLDGTVHDPHVYPSVFKDLTTEMKNYLVGNAEQNAQ